MPPQIALIICIVGVIFLLYWDARQKPDGSYALWLPWLWFGIFASRAISYWFGMGVASDSPDYYLEGSPFDRIVFIVLIIAGSFALWARKPQWGNIIKNNKIIFLYIAYLGLSTLWSDFTFVSFKRWVKELGNIIMILIIITEDDPIESFSTMIKRLAYVLVPFSIVFNKYYPEIGRMYSIGGGDPQFIGVTTHKNSLGAICVVFGLVIFWNLLLLIRNNNNRKDAFEKLIYIVYLVMIVSLLHMSRSATSIFVATLGALLIIIMNSSAVRFNFRLVKYYLIFATLILLSVHLAFDIQTLTASSLGRDETLTGRTQIWEEVLAVKNNPLIGTGYQSFWLGERAEYFWDKYWWKPNQAHNGYLETYINLGLIGLGLLLLVILSAGIKIFRDIRNLRNYDFQILRLAFWITFLLVNITEARLVGIFWLVFLFIAFEAPAGKMREVKLDRAPTSQIMS